MTFENDVQRAAYIHDECAAIIDKYEYAEGVHQYTLDFFEFLGEEISYSDLVENIESTVKNILHNVEITLEIMDKNITDYKIFEELHTIFTK